MRRQTGIFACLTVLVGASVVFISMSSASAAPTRYEAESTPATCSGLIESNHAGFSGAGFCNGNNAVGAAVQFTVNATGAGAATLGIRFANGTTGNRPADISVNGVVLQASSAFNGTGAWTAWTTKTLTAQVNAGSNTIRLSPTTANGLANIDFLDFEAGLSPSPSSSPTGSPPASYPNPIAITGSTGAHDPTVLKTASGGYIVAVTGNNLPLKTSANRTAWSNAGAVWPGGAPWTTTYTGGSANLWAPDLSFHNGQYYLYYSASTFGSQRSAIFLATSPTAASGSWTNQGLIIESSTAVNYNAIDPNLIVDAAGQWWLTFGSFWTGIKQIRLDPATGRRSTTDTAVRPVAQRTTASGAVEAPTVYRRGNFYYLFVSFDLCCRGASSTYRVMVGRSTAINGPYVDRNGVAMTSGGGTQILAAHGSIHGPGHQAILNDNGTEFLFYHYYADNGASFLGINRLGWDAGGWPFVF